MRKSTIERNIVEHYCNTYGLRSVLLTKNFISIDYKIFKYIVLHIKDLGKEHQRLTISELLCSPAIVWDTDILNLVLENKNLKNILSINATVIDKIAINSHIPTDVDFWLNLDATSEYYPLLFIAFIKYKKLPIDKTLLERFFNNADNKEKNALLSAIPFKCILELDLLSMSKAIPHIEWVDMCTRSDFIADDTFMSTYNLNLSWYMLSANPSIQWTEEQLHKYKNKFHISVLLRSNQNLSDDMKKILRDDYDTNIASVGVNNVKSVSDDFNKKKKPSSTLSVYGD